MSQARRDAAEELIRATDILRETTRAGRATSHDVKRAETATKRYDAETGHRNTK